MQLTHIKLAGFKSFVDPTVISVTQNLVGIVGPNGCGKSNIIDAVKWVLGESKASALRGDSMQDVIFAGTNKRKAVGRASVELIFENFTPNINAHRRWSNFSEISIKRILQRDGISNYYLNNIQVRRRDIADIFLGTGVGGRGYAIIEQGMISRIIEAKPFELKSFLEEAAGTSQYRERKLETTSRLYDAQKNIARLEDVHQELQQQQQHLEKQAEVAQKYQLLQASLQTTQSLIWLQRRREAVNQRGQAENTIVELSLELNKILSNQHHAEKQYELIREKELKVNEQLQQAQGELYAINAEISRLEQEINYLKSTDERLEQQIQEIKIQLNKNNQLKETAQNNLSHWYQEEKKAEVAHQDSLVHTDKMNEELLGLETTFFNCQEELNQNRQSLSLIEQLIQLETSHLTNARKNIQQLEIRHSRLLKEQAELACIDPLLLIELQSKINETENALENECKTHQNLEKDSLDLNQQRKKLDTEIQETQHLASLAKARFRALQELQQKLSNNQSINTWSDAHQINVLPRLWQKIQIHPDWENALESVLRERLNAIEIKQLDLIQSWIDDSPSDKWNVYEKPLSITPTSKHQPLSFHSQFKRLLDYLTTTDLEIQNVLENWLRSIYVIETLQDGFEKRHLLKSEDMLVMREGHFFTQHTFTFYAPDSQLHGVLSRQQELTTIEKEIHKMDSQLNTLKHLLETITKESILLKRAIASSTENIKNIQQQRHELQIELVKLSQIKERTLDRATQIDLELAEIKPNLESEMALENAANQKLLELPKQLDELRELTHRTRQAWEKSNQSLINQRNNISQSTKKMQEAAFHVKTCQSKISETIQAIASIDENLHSLAEKFADLIKEKESLDSTSLKKQKESFLIKRQSAEQTTLQLRQEAVDIVQHLREIENSRISYEQKSFLLKDNISQTRLKEQAANIAISQLDELLSNGKVDSAKLEPQLGKKKISELQSEMNRLKAEIESLGPVNLAALTELESVRVRESQLLMQLEDLRVAIMTLENVIQQIDGETQLRLEETFRLVNQYLSEVFPIIFGGGKAQLEFCDNHILESGLLLMAQPPGKKNSSIHLLSGGEKALTALALIFSLFKLNPAPFCLLDEVDAPLDDHNTERFCELVKNMSHQTQFLFISHNKITMEMAHQLIGVTMQEHGVSRVVTVDIASAIKMGTQDKQSLN